MRNPVATAVAIGFGLIVLLGYLIPIPLLTGLQQLLLGWAVTLAGFASLAAIINLIRAHWKRISAPQDRDYFSPLLILAFLLTAGAGLVFGVGNAQFQQVVLSIQFPIEASLMAVLAIALAYSSLRILQRRSGLMGIVFVISTLVFLAISSGVLTASQDIPLLKDVLTLLQRLPVAGARGILLGIALGGLVTGLRIFLGSDRPYSG